MSTVMIHPATYENVRQAVDRAFEMFPAEFHGKKVLIISPQSAPQLTDKARMPSTAGAKRAEESSTIVF